MQERNVGGALSKYLKSQELMKLILYKYHSEIGKCNDKIAKCYAILG